MFQVDAGAFIRWPANGEAHDLRNVLSLHMIGIIVAHWLDFDVVDYSEQKLTNVSAFRPVKESC